MNRVIVLDNIRRAAVLLYSSRIALLQQPVFLLRAESRDKGRSMTRNLTRFYRHIGTTKTERVARIASTGFLTTHACDQCAQPRGFFCSSTVTSVDRSMSKYDIIWTPNIYCKTRWHATRGTVIIALLQADRLDYGILSFPNGDPTAGPRR